MAQKSGGFFSDGKVRLMLIALVFSLVSTACDSSVNPPWYPTTTTTNNSSADSGKPIVSYSSTTSSDVTENSTSDTTTAESSDTTDLSSVQTSTPAEQSNSSSATTDSPVTAAPTTTTLTSSSTTTTSTAAPTQAPVTTTKKNLTPSPSTIITPKASGSKVSENEKVKIDYSNTDDGYVMVKYTGQKSNIRLRIIAESGMMNTYVLQKGAAYEAFPLFDGNGTYEMIIYENDGGKSYATAHSASISVSLSSEFAPFLVPTQYVKYDKNTDAVEFSSELCAGAQTALEKVDAVYGWIIDNVDYDKNSAEKLNTTNYVPVVDDTLKSKEGICFDYSSLAAAMLRSQNVPTKVVIGYAGEAYHAWISVYTKESGWVCSSMYFDGKKWVRMDPTYAASGNSSDYIINYINKNSNYTVVSYN